MIEFLKDYKVRRWIYGVATAVLIYLAGTGVISAVQHENINGIVSAVLSVSAAGATSLAARKSGVVPSDIPNEKISSNDVVVIDEDGFVVAEDVSTYEIQDIANLADISDSAPKHAA